MNPLVPLLIAFALQAVAAPPVGKLKVPPEYKVSVYAYPVPDARSLSMGPDGIVFVGSRKAGAVYALIAGSPSVEVRQLASGLNMPNGVAYKDGDLYVAEVDQVRIYRGVREKLKKRQALGKGEPFGPKFPSHTHHGWKFIAFGPDGWLYVPVGAPCNVCAEDETMFAALHKISPDGSKRELVAKGIRNTVGFDWDPQTKKLWFTDNGRDWLGDDLPPDELNRVDGSPPAPHFGFPHCHGRAHPDPKFNSGRPCDKGFVSPQFEFPAHSASLGMRFARQLLKNSILVAQHGSWNRSTPIGYQVVRLERVNEKVIKSEPFVSGFLGADGSAWGRPVDVLELPGGDWLVSDDAAGAVYKITSASAPVR